MVIAHNGPQLIQQIDQRHRAILYAHNTLFQTYGAREARRALDRVDMIICVSDFLAGQISWSLPPHFDSRIRVVPNGVDSEVFHPRGDERRSQQRLGIVYVGRVIPQKGVDVLVNAVLRLGRPDISLKIYGSSGFDPSAPLSDYEKSLRLLAERRAGSIEFSPTVPRSEVPAIMRNADLVVVPSRWPEPFGLTVLEGMASGVPVIASAIGGIPQAAGGNAVLVPADDPEALEGQIARMADDEAFRRAAGGRARRHAETFTWQSSRRMFDELMSELR